MTREEFVKLVGREPEDDDLDRANCADAGKFGHRCCGLCSHCGKPRFVCPRDVAGLEACEVNG